MYNIIKRLERYLMYNIIKRLEHHLMYKVLLIRLI